MPMNLRPKLTRAKRRALTPKQMSLKAVKVAKREMNILKRRFYVLD